MSKKVIVLFVYATSIALSAVFGLQRSNESLTSKVTSGQICSDRNQDMNGVQCFSSLVEGTKPW